MKIISMEAENFKAYSRLVLPEKGSFGQGLFLINGKNSMGKTSLIQCVLWGLLGDGLMDVQRKLLLRIGQSCCRVVINFEIGGHEYRIQRELKTTLSNTLKPDAILFKKQDEKFITVKKGFSEVNKEVETMLGLTADSIKRTIYVGQKDVDRLAKADPKELRELLVDLFGLGEFDRVKDSLKERQARLQGSISELTKQVSAIPTLQLELKSKQTELSSDEGEIERKEDELDKDEALVSRIPSEEALTKLNEVNERLHELQESLTKIETEIKNHLAYLADQQKRTTDFTDMIIALKKDLSVAQSNLTNFPPTETIKVLKDISLRINTLEQQIRNHIRNQRVQLDFDPIVEVDEPNARLELVLGKIEELTLKRNGICESVENLKTKKSTDQTLIDIKTKSMEYILGKNRCPVCNKSVKQSKEMISVIEKEISGVRQSVDDTAANISRQTAEFNKVNSEIEIETDLKRLLEQISLLNLKDARLQLARELENIAEESVNNILTKTNSNSLDDVMMNFNIIMANIGSIQSRINDNSHNLKVETTKYKQYQGQLKIMNTKRESLLTQKLAIETELKNQLIDLSASSVEDLTTKYACKNILEIITKKKSIEQRIALKLEGLNSIRDRVISLKTDLRNRILALEKLIAKENQLKEANRELRHLKFLRGETDGFVSKYVFERKLAEILKEATNFYLRQFTEGRYSIDRIFSTTRRSQGIESHGIEVTLNDNKDGIIKVKDQLSGGDETAVGLALRISISKLMSRIKPFKNAELKSPMVNSIILDEPMSSLDTTRRNILMRTLMMDKSFKQVFLITHTDTEMPDCHSILVSEDGTGKRVVEYKPCYAPNV